MKISIYKNNSDREPYTQWLNGLDKPFRERIEALVERLEDNPQIGKYLTDGISELKLRRGAGYRVYYSVIDDTAYLQGGGEKATQAKDIYAAAWNLEKLKGRLSKQAEVRSR